MNVPFAFASVDLESTGTNPQEDRVVEIAIIFYAPGLEPISWRSLVNPGIPIPEGASEIHGIYDWDVEGAPRFQDLLGEITTRLRHAQAICGYNARRFDIPMMQAEFSRAGGTWPGDGKPILDPITVWTHLNPRTLTGAAKHWLGEDFTNAHGALPDAEIAARVLLAQLERHTELPLDPHTLEMAVLPEDAKNWVDPEGKLMKTPAGVVVNVGKHKGVLLSKVPPDYLSWMLKNMALQPNARQHVEAALKA